MQKLTGDIDILVSLPGRLHFLNLLTFILDHFTKAYDNYLILGDFNLEPHDKRLGYFLNSNNLVNPVKINTYITGSGSCIDLILTNRK